MQKLRRAIPGSRQLDQGAPDGNGNGNGGGWHQVDPTAPICLSCPLPDCLGGTLEPVSCRCPLERHLYRRRVFKGYPACHGAM